MRIRPHAIAAICLARDDRRSQHSFRQVVGGFQLIHLQETQEMRTVFTQLFGKTGIVAIRKTALGWLTKSPSPSHYCEWEKCVRGWEFYQREQ